MKKSTIWKKLLMVLGALVAVVAIVVASVLGTVAYLTQSASIVNTFTVGNVSITLDETAVDINGNPLVDAEGNPTGERTITGCNYKLIPGHEYTKDPVLTVNEGSENSLLFIHVKNGLSKQILNEGSSNDLSDNKIETDGLSIEYSDPDNKHYNVNDQLINNGWRPYTMTATGIVYVYCGKGENDVVNESATLANVGKYDLFEKIHVDPDVDDLTLKLFNAATIEIIALAIQGQEFSTLDENGNRVVTNENLKDAWAALLSTYSHLITDRPTQNNGDNQ